MPVKENIKGLCLDGWMDWCAPTPLVKTWIWISLVIRWFAVIHKVLYIVKTNLKALRLLFL